MILRDGGLLLKCLWGLAVVWMILWSYAFIASLFSSYPSLPEPLHAIWEVPFPAVTICSQIKFRNLKINISDAVNKELTLDPDQLKLISDASLLCDQHVDIAGNKTTDMESIVNIKKNAQPFEEALYACTWKNELANCTKFFNETLTSEGLCYTSNMLKPDDMFRTNNSPSGIWDPERGYSYSSSMDVYPRRAEMMGTRLGLNIILISHRSSHDHYCRGPLEGFKMQFHNPAEIPFMDSEYIRVPLDMELLIGVEPEIRRIHPIEKNLSPQDRGCYYGQERRLTLFRKYTKRNCEFECLRNETLKICKCLPFFFHIDSDPAPLCGGGSKKCILTIREKVQKEEMKTLITGVPGGPCECLPECDKVSYNLDITQSKFNWEKVLEAYKENSSLLDGYSMSRTTIYLKDNPYVKEVSTLVVEPYSPLEAKQAGSLLALSFLSLVMYVMILFYIEIKNHNRGNVHGDEPLTSYME